MKGPPTRRPRMVARALGRAALLLAVPALLAPPAVADVPTSGAVYQDGPSSRYLVGGTWYRRADPRDRGRTQRWQRAQSLAGWAQTTIPNAANAGDDSARSYLGGVWWYRKDFQAPAGSSSKTTWLLRFESVNYRATVYLNGRRIGGHLGGDPSFPGPAPGPPRNRAQKAAGAGLQPPPPPH